MHQDDAKNLDICDDHVFHTIRHASKEKSIQQFMGLPQGNNQFKAVSWNVAVKIIVQNLVLGVGWAQRTGYGCR
jgi:hypothetical protein